MSVIKMTDLDLAGKRVFIRADLNVPVKEGKVTSDARIRASLPTIELALKQGAKVMVTSHLGRPTEGEYNEEFSLLPVVNYLKDKLSNPVRLVKDYLDGVDVAEGELVVLENVRFNKGEKKDDEALSKKYAALCDVFVMDAFGTAHRAQASTHGIGKFADVACAGPLLAAELDALGKALKEPARPMVAIVGGSKVSTKLTVLDSLSKIADQLIVGGGIANTFVAAQGHSVGKSLYEADLVDEAKRLLTTCDIPVPTDVRVATEFSETAPATLKSVNDVKEDEQILDIGDASGFSSWLKSSRMPKPFCGTARLACLSSRTSVKGLKSWRMPSLIAKRFPSLAAATPWRQSTCSALLTKSPTFLLAAVHSSNSWKVKFCQP